MAKYKRYDYSQSVLIPVALEEQLVPGTLEFAIHTLVDSRMDILLVCDQEGLLGGSFFAIDGCKMSSNASKEWSGKISDLQKRKGKIESKLKALVEDHIQISDLSDLPNQGNIKASF